jgi:hypothetical protein
VVVSLYKTYITRCSLIFCFLLPSTLPNYLFFFRCTRGFISLFPSSEWGQVHSWGLSLVAFWGRMYGFENVGGSHFILSKTHAKYFI